MSEEKLTARQKLRLLKSPLISTDSESESSVPVVLSPHGEAVPNLKGMGDRVGPATDTPEFQKHDDASILELFFDLFFAANYTVFSQTQSVTSSQRFTAYIGYFCLLWMTWLLVGLYDVRFVTDSIFERLARGVHLGVMVGFAVVAPNFDPSDQNRQTMRTMSIILMVSRLCLTVEYSSILWHVRKFKSAHVPFLIQIAMNFSAAMTYLGITFRFRHENSHVFIAWYIISVLEVILAFVISNYWEVLSFTNTHLMKRMSLLTIIILGDGIVLMAQNVVTIVKTPDAWNTLTIGIVTAATVTTYIVFMVYFDFMKRDYLPAWRQQAWTIIHFPFHLALVLFMQGFTQFIIWSKIVDVLNHLTFDSIMNNVDRLADSTSTEIFNNLQNITTGYFKLYPPKYYDTWESVDIALKNVTNLPDKFWPELAKWLTTEADADIPPTNEVNLFIKIMDAITASMTNALYENFGIDLYTELLKKNATVDVDGGGFQDTVQQKTWDRYMLVFAYGYVAAGSTLALMTVLTIISRIERWKTWHLVRTIIYFLLALGLGLVAVIYYIPSKADNYLFSPWVLPTISIVWFIVLVLTHLHNAPPLFFSQSAAQLHSEQHQYDHVAMPMPDQAPIHRKPVSGVQEWDLGIHQRQSGSFFGQTGPDGIGYSSYIEQPATYMPHSYGSHGSPQETAYDSYQSSTEFRHGYS